MWFYCPAVPAEITGEKPLACFGPEFGGREDYSSRDWTGCLDAPERIAAGSTSNRNYDELPASTNYIR